MALYRNDSPVRILALQPILTGYFLSPLAGGKSKVADYLLLELARRRHQLFVLPVPVYSEAISERITTPMKMRFGPESSSFTLLSTGKPQLRRLFKLDGLNVRQLFRHPRSVLRAFLDNWAFDFKRAIVDAVREAKPDIILVHQSGTPAVNYLKQLDLRCPLVLIHHNPIVSKFVCEYDHVVSVSQWQFKEFSTSFPELEQRMTMIPYFVDEVYHQQTLLEPKRRIVFIGVLNTERKGLDILIDALEKIPAQKRPALDVIGEGGLLETYRKQAQAAKLDVTFHGRLPDTRNAELVAGSAALVVPSRAESFGIVYTEALCCGTPVIGYAKTVSELCETLHPKSGIPYDAESGAEELSRAISQLLDSDDCFDSELRKELSRTARDNYKRERYAERIDTLLTTLAEKS